MFVSALRRNFVLSRATASLETKKAASATGGKNGNVPKSEREIAHVEKRLCFQACEGERHTYRQR